MRLITDGLRFPEGPVAMDDGSVVLVEIERGAVSRVAPDGTISVVAECGGGPNGAAVGPDGRLFVANNGGFVWHDEGGILRPGLQPGDYRGGSIQAVDLATGAVEELYTRAGERPLKGPNDLVFDRHGGFYFTDLGKTRLEDGDRGAIYYAAPDGSSITTVAHPVERPNGIGLSPDDAVLYYAETPTGRVWAIDLDAPGVARPAVGGFRSGTSATHGRLLANVGGDARLDSLAVDSEGNVCVATLVEGVVTVIAPDGRVRAKVPVPVHDPFVTNICFGGPDLATAYVTSSGLGRLYAIDWFCPGHPLWWLNRDGDR